MMLRVWFVALFLVLPSASQAADKEIVRLQRDVAFLNEDVRRLHRSIDERMDKLVVLVQQALDRVSQVQEASSLTQRTLVEKENRRESKQPYHPKGQGQHWGAGRRTMQRAPESPIMSPTVASAERGASVKTSRKSCEFWQSLTCPWDGFVRTPSVDWN
jgi:hypothetical protein